MNEEMRRIIEMKDMILYAKDTWNVDLFDVCFMFSLEIVYSMISKLVVKKKKKKNSTSSPFSSGATGFSTGRFSGSLWPRHAVR